MAARTAVAIMGGICTRHLLRTGEIPDLTTTVSFLVHLVHAQSKGARRVCFIGGFATVGAATEDCRTLVGSGVGSECSIFQYWKRLD